MPEASVTSTNLRPEGAPGVRDVLEEAAAIGEAAEEEVFVTVVVEVGEDADVDAGRSLGEPGGDGHVRERAVAAFR